MITKYLIVFLISMVPLIELRGAIPYAVAFHIPTLPAYLIAGFPVHFAIGTNKRFRLFSCSLERFLSGDVIKSISESSSPGVWKKAKKAGKN